MALLSQASGLKKAIEAGTGVTIKLEFNDLQGEHALALTEPQIKKMANAYQNGKETTIKMSKTQLDYNKKRVKGGLLLH